MNAFKCNLPITVLYYYFRCNMFPCFFVCLVPMIFQQRAIPFPWQDNVKWDVLGQVSSRKRFNYAELELPKRISTPDLILMQPADTFNVPKNLCSVLMSDEAGGYGRSAHNTLDARRETLDACRSARASPDLRLAMSAERDKHVGVVTRLHEWQLQKISW